jgi:hypothetical protein
LLSRSPEGILLLELHGEGIRNGGENDHPSRMKIDGYPEDFADAHSGALRHIEWFWDARWRLPWKMPKRVCVPAAMLPYGPFSDTTTIALIARKAKRECGMRVSVATAWLP